MGKDRLSHDFETYSDLDLKQVGAARYARHPSTEILMLAYSFNEGRVQQWVPADGEPVPKDLKEALTDPEVVKQAWNSSFERQIWTHTAGIPIPFEQWYDPMILAMTLSMPGSLEKVGEIVGLAEEYQKIARGRALIRMFCQPRKPTKNKPWTRNTAETNPEEWEEFLGYNRQDVVAELKIWKKLRKWDLPQHEWDLWHLDQRINERGIPVNREAVRNAIQIRKAVVSSRMAEMKEITGLDNPNSTQQLLPWLQAQGYPFEDLKKGHVERALEGIYEQIDMNGNDGAEIALFEPYIDVLERRLETSKSSVKKFDAIERSVDEDGMLRNTLQFAGAQRTWRWGGRIYQPQNLARPTKDLEKCMEMAVDHVERLDAESIEWLYDKPMDLLASCVRPVVQAPEGHLLADADLNAIENRVLGWVAQCQRILDVFRDGRCPYLDFATSMYHEPYEDLWAEYDAGNKEKRTNAKPAVLGCFGPETEVLTDSGWKKIIHVTRSDMVFDGVEFVDHGGVINQGEKRVIELAGVVLTPDHRILVGETWRPAWELKRSRNLMNLALRSASGSFSGENIAAGRGGTTGAGAPAVGSLGSEVRTYAAASVQSAASAPGETERTRLGRKSGDGSMKPTQTGSTPFDLDVGTQRTRHTPTMAAAASNAVLLARKILSTISLPWRGLGTWAWKWTAETTTAITSRGTFDWSGALLRTATGGTHGAWLGVGGFTVSRNSIERSARVTGTHQPFAASSWPAKPWSRWWKSKGTAAVRTVYDILNAGPRNRFVIRTEQGPLIVHNCGYMLSAGFEKENKKTGEIEATGLLGYARDMGIHMTPDQTDHAVKTFRSTYDEVVQFWWDIDRAVRRTIKTGKPQRLNMLTFDRSGPFLRIRLPSGRHLHYCRPRMEMRKMPWGKMKEAITYEGLNDKKKWTRIQTHPGKLTENVVQAIARDLLAHGMVLADREGLDIRLHVHDQIVALVPKSSSKLDLALLRECMSDQPEWASGLPLAADGFLSPVFQKD